MTYEAPQLNVLGSFSELTLSGKCGPGADAFTSLTGVIGSVTECIPG